MIKKANIIFNYPCIHYSFIIILLACILLVGCKNKKTDYFDNGQIKSEINFKNGHYDGVATWYYENGLKQYEFNYVNDTLQGKSTRWYSNGKIRSIQNYKDNLLDGEVLNFDENGKKLREEHYTNDTLNGPSIDFYTSGKPKIEGQYYKGLYDGKWFYYEDDGTLIGLGEFDRGNGKQRAWYRGGILKREVRYQDNEKHGPEKWFLPDGSPDKIIVYDHGQVISADSF